MDGFVSPLKSFEGAEFDIDCAESAALRLSASFRGLIVCSRFLKAVIDVDGDDSQ